MNPVRFGITPGFAKALVPAALGGALWEAIGLPLGWLMGAAVVAGAFAAADVEATVPRPLYNVSLAALGASVGLAITSDVAAALVGWAPVMAIAGALGILGAVLMAPVLARFGRMDRSTAFFSLLPGGVIEMATVGEQHGADRTIVSALHAVRVGLVVGLLPLVLFFFFDASGSDAAPVPPLPPGELALLMAVGLTGGLLGAKAGMPAAWLLGALVLVGLVSSFGALPGRMPEPVLATVQVLVGLSLGSRFQRSRLSAIPRALIAGTPILLVIMAGMALAATVASIVMPFSLPTLILCFSIGGMAEMVLTSKALGQNVALVAAFQAVRAVLVNATAGAVWSRLASPPDFPDSPKG